MAIVTVSRGTFSGGQQLATYLGETLGYGVISRELLVQAAARYGVNEQALVRLVEQPPTLWDRFRVQKQTYLAVLRATLCDEVRRDNVVYHAIAGHLLLHGVQPVLRVRVIAPQSYRVRAAMAAHGFDARQADAYIRARDEERVRWARFIYGVDWRDPALYDVVFNLERITVEGACRIIAYAVTRPEFALCDVHRRQLDDLWLASHVKAKLLTDPRTGAAAATLEVTARGASVRLAGMPNGVLGREIVATVQGIEGVGEVVTG
jgi:cytidylate kinase